MPKPLIQFEEPQDVPILRYDVPEPCTYEGRTYTELNLPDAFFSNQSRQSPDDYLANFLAVNQAAIAEYLTTVSKKTLEQVLCSYNLDKTYSEVDGGIRVARVEVQAIAAEQVVRQRVRGQVKLIPTGTQSMAQALSRKDKKSQVAEYVGGTNPSDTLADRYELFRQRLNAAVFDDGMLPVLRRSQSGKLILSFVAMRDAKPRLVLIEAYRLTSCPGDYGAGATVQTFSLLPGEETEISVKTWRKSETAISQASSVLDSYTDEKADEFESSIQSENTRSEKVDETFSYHAEAKAEASWGWGSAEVSGGVAGSTAASRESTSKNVMNATEKHASKASAKREVNVETSSSSKQESGSEQATLRRLKNINVSRTLNFVFRQLNQEYLSILHLVDLRVGFYNGYPGSMREYTLPQLQDLVGAWLNADVDVQNPQLVPHDPAHVQNGRLDVLKFLQDFLLYEYGGGSGVLDHEGASKSLIEQVDPPPQQGNWRQQRRAYLRVAPPAASKIDEETWKGRQGVILRPGAPDQNGQPAVAPVRRFVDGVVISTKKVVMRTSGLIVEALMGNAPALDEYARNSQDEALRERQLANRRVVDLLAKLDELGPAEYAENYAAVFNPPVP